MITRKAESMMLKLVLMGLAWACLAWAGDDVVVTTTGDRLVGEIKRLERDVLVFETDYSDADFRIKWEKVASIESKRSYLVETFEGRRLTGAIQMEPKTKQAEVGGAAVALREVAAVQPFERSFGSRFDAGFDIGFSMTKANGARQLSAGGNLVYRDERNYVGMSANALSNTRSQAPRTRRWEVGTEYKRLLGPNWYASATNDLLSSDEQNLRLRTTLGAGAGRYFLRSRQQYLGLGAGLAWTNESYRDPALPRRDSAEGFAGAEFKTERLKVFDVLMRGTVFPSLTIAGRLRANFRTDLDFNLPGDWYLRTGYYNNFDSKPPAGLARNDYGWSNSFGFKF